MSDLLEQIAALEHASSALDPGPEERAALYAAATASGERYLAQLDEGHAFRPGDARGLLTAPIGGPAVPLATAIDLLEREVIAPGGHPASPAHLAYIPGGALVHSAVADFLAAMSNKYPGISFTGPGPSRMEQMLVRWVADVVGLPASAGGSIASGGSLANLTAVTTARDARGLRSAAMSRAVVYLTEQTHHCIAKALRIAGLAEAPVRTVAMDVRYRMRADALAEAIAEDRARGLLPWLVVATAGTTDTGAVDPLAAIADVAERAGCWFHVDAAYGGFFLLTEHGRRVMAGIERADSVVLDPHKSLFLPWGSGIVLVRDVRALAASQSLTGHYLQDAQDANDPEALSPADLSPELTKHFRALRMWLPLVTLGIGPFRAALEEKLLLARYLRAGLAEAGFEVGPEPDLSTVTYRFTAPGATGVEQDALNAALLDAVRQDGRVFLSSTRLDGHFTLRACVLAFRTHRRSIDLALQVLREQAALLAR
jgi:glutamate/tyrosine decarboxylase-like PLP-dependent enzyme